MGLQLLMKKGNPNVWKIPGGRVGKRMSDDGCSWNWGSHKYFVAGLHMPSWCPWQWWGTKLSFHVRSWTKSLWYWQPTRPLVTRLQTKNTKPMHNQHLNYHTLLPFPLICTSSVCLLLPCLACSILLLVLDGLQISMTIRKLSLKVKNDRRRFLGLKQRLSCL